MVGYCRLREAMRDFRASRIRDAEILGETFERLKESDWHANDMGQPDDVWSSRTGCFALEERAYATEQRYMTWLANRFGPLPSDAAETDAELSYAADDLYANMMHLNNTDDIAAQVRIDYANAC